MKLKIKKFKCEDCEAEYEALSEQGCPSCEGSKIKLLSEEEIDMGSSCGGGCSACPGC